MPDYCERCGKKILNSFGFCASCGSRAIKHVEDDTDESQSPRKAVSEAGEVPVPDDNDEPIQAKAAKRKRARTIVLIVAAILVPAAILYAIGAYRSYQKAAVNGIQYYLTSYIWQLEKSGDAGSTYYLNFEEDSYSIVKDKNIIVVEPTKYTMVNKNGFTANGKSYIISFDSDYSGFTISPALFGKETSEHYYMLH